MADIKATRLIPSLPAGLSPEQRRRYEEVAAIARTAADRLPRPMEKALEPAHVFRIHTKRLS